MIEVDDAVFPNNIVKYVASAQSTGLEDVSVTDRVKVFQRPLRNTDPVQSVGVTANSSAGDPESIEMQGFEHPAPQMPTLQTYLFSLQAFVKDSVEERGLNVHSVLASRARMVLYTDPNLQVIFAALQADLGNGLTEKMSRWGVGTTRFYSNEIQGQFLFLSTLEFWVQTETTWQP